jgi:hypothetical protein
MVAPVAALLFLLVMAGTVAAHDATATMTCGAGGTVVNVNGSGWPAGSTYSLTVDGGSAQGPFDANTGATDVHDAGSPTVAHTAVVTFASSDGQTQFDFVFQLSAEACAQATPSQSTDPSQSTEPTPTPSGGELPTQSAGASPSPSSQVEGVTGTPGTTPPPTDSLGAGQAPGDESWRIALGVLAVTLLIAIAIPRPKRGNKRR